jgi:hypothetical protein
MGPDRINDSALRILRRFAHSRESLSALRLFQQFQDQAQLGPA